MEKFAIGIDFGGTKVAAGVVNLETGRLVAAAKKKTRNVPEQENVIKRLQAVIDELLSESNIDIKQIKGIGIGVAGMVDRQKGVLLAAANIGANDMPLVEPISKFYGIPCRIGNDVEVATYAELHYGAGRNCNSFICIFVGTGIGSGIVNEGILRLGATATAGEIGHMCLIPEGRLCGCGSFGCLETYASRTAVAKSILADLERGADSVIRDKVDLTKGILRSKAIAQAIAQGDELVTNAVTRAAEFLGIGLASVINFYNPKRIILGGGLVEASDLYLKVAEKEAKRRALKIPARKIEIVKAELGDYSGIIGAALLMK
jgi:glucokinase